MENMVPQSEEDKLWDKRGKEALAQFTNMIMVVSFNSFSRYLQVLYISSLTISLSYYRVLWQRPRPTRIAKSL